MNNFSYGSYRSNAAEQLEQAPKVQRAPQLKVRSNGEVSLAQEKVKYRIKVLFCLVVLAAVFFAGMSGYVKCNELDIKIGEQQKALSELQSENVRLMSEVEKKQNRDVIEQYAVNVLGMQPIQEYQKNTIKIERQDTLVSLETDENDKSVLDIVSDKLS